MSLRMADSGFLALRDLASLFWDLFFLAFFSSLLAFAYLKGLRESIYRHILHI